MTTAAHVFLTWVAALLLLVCVHARAKRAASITEALAILDGAMSLVLVCLGIWLAIAALRGTP